MLWYKAWLETRWRFLIGLVLLMCSAMGVVFTYPKVLELMPMLPAIKMGGELGRQLREAAELTRDYRGYVWLQWFRKELPQLGTLFAVLLGTGGLISQRAALFTLSLPASRRQLLGVRAAAGLAEFLVLVLVPSLLVPLFSPGIGQSYGLGGTLVHAACVFVAGAAFYSLAVLLSTVFGDVWRPLLIALLIAMVLGLVEPFVRGLSRFSIYRVMSAESYFRTGGLPWLGLLASAALSVALLYGAARNIERQDF